MNHAFLDRFQSIGFTLTKSEDTNNDCTIHTWNYYPQWLVDKHFTLVFFQSKWEAEFRLYIHHNSDGSYYDSPFQLSYNYRTSDYLNLEFDRIFISDLRNTKLDRILWT